ncbi:MAG: AbrB/MazE/SpoVT family DNA-binding domain-containing protein [Desulfurococcaceae archaeon]
MLKRRVQVIGDTFIISIPKEWARLHGLQKQDEVFMEILPDLSLLVIPSPRSIGQHSENTVELELTGNIRYDLMNIISRYLVGYDEFYIKINQSNPDYLKLFQDELTSRVLGLEVVSYEDNLLVIKNIAGDFSIGINEIVDRLFKILDSTLQDFLTVLESKVFDKNRLMELVEKDSLADKLTLYSLRVLNKILLGKHLPREYGFSSFLEVNILYDILRNLERSIDHVTYIARGLLRSPVNLIDEDRSHVVRHVKALREFADTVRRLVSDFQYELVYRAIAARYNEIAEIESRYVDILTRNPHVYLIIDNLRRIKAYLHDIVELMMDKNAVITRIQRTITQRSQ